MNVEANAHISFKHTLRDRRFSLGSWIQIPDAGIAEILASAGFDWIGIDLEHSGIDIPQLMQILRGLYGRGVAPLARVRANDTLAIRQALDVGAAGVIVPLVHTAEEARRAVEASKYPPEGMRGFCYSRMNDWGVNFEEYASRANKDVVVIVMIESVTAVENVDAILEVDGVDAVFIGPYDLSGSYGVPGQTQHHLVVTGCLRVIEACQRAGKAAGLHVVKTDPQAIEDAIGAGYTFLALGADIVFVDNAARSALKCARRTLSILPGSGEFIECMNLSFPLNRSQIA